MKIKILLVSVLTIVVCASIIIGSTLALFETKANVSIAVTAANLDVTAIIEDGKVLNKSYNETQFLADGFFANGGYASVNAYDPAKIDIAGMTPGDAIRFNIDVINDSNIPVAYRVVWNVGEVETTKNLGEVLRVTVKVNGGALSTAEANSKATKYYKVDANKDITTEFEVTVEFPYDLANANDYREAAANLSFTVEAVQANKVP